MDIIRFILHNWDSVLVVFAFVAGVIALYKKGEVKVLEEILFGLVTEAERLYGTGTGSLKKAAVFEWIYEKIPVLIKLFISKKELEKLIERVLDYAKEKWKVNPGLGEYVYGRDIISTN